MRLDAVYVRRALGFETTGGVTQVSYRTLTEPSLKASLTNTELTGLGGIWPPLFPLLLMINIDDTFLRVAERDLCFSGWISIGEKVIS